MKKDSRILGLHKISGYDQMEPFFMTLASPTDHWLFLSSTGGLTAGRVSPENALFPYETVDKLHESWRQTGAKTIIFAKFAKTEKCWKPFNIDISTAKGIERNLYKSILGDEIIFEEKNRSLELVFRYSWRFSPKFGFVRNSQIVNTGRKKVQIRVLDGVQNILPANTDRKLQTESSCLLDAYKRSELLPEANLSLYYYNSIPTDLAEAMESLKASIAWSTGMPNPIHLLSSAQIANFANGKALVEEVETRGVRGAYLLASAFRLAPDTDKSWTTVLDVNRDIRHITELQKLSKGKKSLADLLEADIAEGRSRLAALLASADAFQFTADRRSSSHHLSNVLFNIMRGGVFADSGRISPADFLKYVHSHNRDVAQAAEKTFPPSDSNISLNEFNSKILSVDNINLRRIAAEYLPLTFSRRHGDPSRPWNHFAINVLTETGEKRLSYQGNWRDLFQNWEALCLSFPEFIFNVIAKFLNATNAEGYNPYRVSREGFEWEVPEPDNPWANIGYWGDHQIIYLLRLLELARKTFPEKMHQLLHEKIYAYSNIPYRIKPYPELCANPRTTISFEHKLNDVIQEKQRQIGNDAKLLHDENGNIIHVSMLEKIIVPLLSKITNLVPEGGIWLNTQRPEWNDANNALAGYGLSMVTVYYIHRYILFFGKLLNEIDAEKFEMSIEIAKMMRDIQLILTENSHILETAPMSDCTRREIMDSLGSASCEFRRKLYANGLSGERTELSVAEISKFIDSARKWIEHSIRANEREDGMFHSYNVMILDTPGEAGIKYLDEMLEGQVAVLSAGCLDSSKAVRLLKTLRKSRMFRKDQYSYMLYPDRKLKTFVEKNVIPKKLLAKSKLLKELLKTPGNGLVMQDAFGKAHFDSAIRNEKDMQAAMAGIELAGRKIPQMEKKIVREIYEEVFRHSEFTGRAGSFFAYEGLGSVYWHMVSKLLLAVQENYLSAMSNNAPDKDCRALLEAYYEIRKGIGFNKTAREYGAFPTDPYSHTPAHSGASQPGMTGQVKEEIITRLGELGVAFHEGVISFKPQMLRREEFLSEVGRLTIPGTGRTPQKIKLKKNTLIFSLCSIPVLYELSDKEGITLFHKNGEKKSLGSTTLDFKTSRFILSRSGEITKISCGVTPMI